MVLDVKDLRYHLPGNGKLLIDGISFSVGAGETLVLLGRSGAGKTTTLKLVNRLLSPTGGAVRIAGEPADAVEPTVLRRRIGYVIQEVGLFPHFTVAGNVGLLPRLEQWPRDRIGWRVRELLSLVGLDPEIFSARFPHQLSGGQRQRVGVARALALDPPLLLLDEPQQLAVRHPHAPTGLAHRGVDTNDTGIRVSDDRQERVHHERRDCRPRTDAEHRNQ